MLDLGTRRVFAEEVVAFPISGRSDWSRNKAATTIRTDVIKHTVNAGCAERAFISTNARCKRVWWQELVAVFAGRAEFEHNVFLNANNQVYPRDCVTAALALQAACQ
jgi:hypothetical protein